MGSRILLLRGTEVAPAEVAAQERPPQRAQFDDDLAQQQDHQAAPVDGAGQPGPAARVGGAIGFDLFDDEENSL